MHEGSTSNGTLTIGGVDARLSVNGSVHYVTDVGRGFHSVEVNSITVQGSGGSAAAMRATVAERSRQAREKAGFAELEAVRAREADAQREVRQAGQELIQEIGAGMAAPKAKKKEEPLIHVEDVKPAGGLPTPRPKRASRQSQRRVLLHPPSTTSSAGTHPTSHNHQASTRSSRRISGMRPASNPVSKQVSQ